MAQLAVNAGVGHKTVERLEYNHRDDADTRTLIGLSDALGVSIDFLLRGSPLTRADMLAADAS